MRPRSLANFPRFMVKIIRVAAPDGSPVYCTNREEVRSVAGQIEVYLCHGVGIEVGDCVVDVGANIGLFALEAARRGANVHAFEPMPATFAALQANAGARNAGARNAGARNAGARNAGARNAGARNAGARNADSAKAIRAGAIRAHNLALGAGAGAATFAYFRWVSALSTRFPAWVGQNAVSGALAILDDAQLAPRLAWLRRAPLWLRRALAAVVVRVFLQPCPVSCRVETLSRAIHALNITKIDLLKIDVEGAEWDVLRGIGAHHWPRIGQVVAEVHDENGRVSQVAELLRSHGFTVVSEPEPQSAAWGVWLVWATREEKPRLKERATPATEMYNPS